MPGTWRHLAARFFRVLAADPLESTEIDRIRGMLRPVEAGFFFAQSHADQRHGLECAVSVEAMFPDRRDLIRAALLHDVGKRHARLGMLGRVLASIAGKLGLPVWGRFRLYLDHGAVAAEELSELGAESVVVEFTRHHHEARPPGFPADEWDVLEAADA